MITMPRPTRKSVPQPTRELVRRHRVEDRIRNAKQTGLGRFPSREFAINAVWLQLALTAADLIAWTQTTLLNGVLGQEEALSGCHTLSVRINMGSRTPSERSSPSESISTKALALFLRRTDCSRTSERLFSGQPMSSRFNSPRLTGP